jgi:adenine-specific DNA-methyltransferase
MRNEIHEQFKLDLLEIFNFESQDYSLSIRKLLNFKKEQIQNLLDNFKPVEPAKGLWRAIYELVIDFFSKYIKNGMIYSKGKSSSIPFNEDGISLEWLNKDQEYVKLKEVPNNLGKFFSEDYFIHKDLKNFLRSELNQFIKDIVFEDESLLKLESEILQERINKAKKIEEIAYPLIELLAQIENIQLELWYKRSLVVDTNYVVTLNKIREYSGEIFLERIIKKIIENNQQTKEWNNLFAFNSDDIPTLKDVKELMRSKWISLPIDTRYFDEEFKWNLLHSFSQEKSLDEIFDGLLIKSDNFQALNLILKRWHEKVNQIYIDPPFNTGYKEYLYKNDYLDSSWLVMMYTRLKMVKEILNKSGNIFVRIDNNGNHYVKFLLNSVFEKSNFRNEIIINKTRAKKQRKKPFIQQTESLLFYSKSKDYFFNQLQLPRKDPRWFELVDFPRPNENPRVVLGKNYYPPKNRRWGLSQERINEFEQMGKVRINQNKKYIDCFGNVIEEKPELYYDLEPIRNDWLDIPGYSQVHKFSTENSEHLLKRVIESGSKEGDIVLDYFLGSGTTIATAQKLNRKWIGIEIGSQFEEFIIPRMKKVLYGDKTGISKNMKPLTGGFFKYQTLEQFEDSIENIEFTPQLNNKFFEFERFDDPFHCKIKILEIDQSKHKYVDLIETFNYILGLDVDQIEKTKENRRTYIFVKGRIGSDNVIIVWRPTFELDLEQDKKIIENQLNNGEYIYIFINGKNIIKNSKSIEIEFKKLIWA